ncbi:MAG: hypothetical protein XD64_1122 [Thermotoga sp. 47_83]|uniref:Pyridinium-3,5-bisthiocarboxylic acid mononucleotide nickel insertion protein n=2 Tax=Thermotoga TaxID=2335 RepID=LARC_THESQ|nr:nickel pincer cofactor biosynthesis protein LarC [Thermotoga sp. RQ2]B1L8M5.1 RecName: Full=Pyridinium-3,5-bisthiocarboxylic acid mononucleotide nickel insertion protein; Short=P2TMN nickel insertion protein; AltName: Full=Nickel-pincer cofactor biosynthesis protein LarC [Thermotoga sp. RQ2]KUK22855.1 MAG: hypothetical protein XD57_1050 [Thermotoga petrophila]KUK33050.1 MAG: hypothetical protein XD64_1122 [Thermotoga sp. 47_83]HBF69775.1 TIGR00299 family protein [Thermotoga sp.]ACB10154.1 p
MRILYLDPFSGISGDMFLGLLVDLGVDPEKIKSRLEKLNVEFEFVVKKENKKGVTATKVDVVFPGKEHHEDHIVSDHDHHHHHGRHLSEIVEVLSRLEDPLKEKAIRMFETLAEAESKIHGLSKEKVHFHEVGAMDAVIEIAGAVAGLELLGVEKVFCGTVNTGSGFVMTEHGRYPVPAPATAELLKGIPIYVDQKVRTELVTPTGAVILKSLVDEFRTPILRVEKVGYGAGTMDLEIPNVLRGYLGYIEPSERTGDVLIETNVDDMSPQLFGHLMERLFEAGAKDVFFTPIYMKKNRPAVKVSVLCHESKKDEILKLLFKESTSIGARVFYPEKVEATRTVKTVKTEYGEIPVKIASFDSEIVNISPEYEACKKIAQEKGIPLKEVYRAVCKSVSEVRDDV